LTQAIIAQFPHYPPYGGRFSSVVPHLTVARGSGHDFACVEQTLSTSLSSLPGRAIAASQKQAEKEPARKVPSGSVRACSLITRADVEKATGQDPYVDPEPAGNGGWICNVGIGELKVYSGPKSWEALESTLKGFKRDNEPRTPAPA